MRQIHVCAWLWLALTACGGGEFSSGGFDKSEATSGSPSAGTAGKQAVSANGGADSVDAGASGGAPANTGSVAGAGSGGRTPLTPPGLGGSSSAGSSSGGSSSAGSNSGQGNNSGQSGGAVAGPSTDCSTDTVTFRMSPSSKLQPEYLCDAGCGSGWLSITDENGATGFPISSACGTASCESCEIRQCTAAACLPTPLSAQGNELVWNGIYLAKGVCGASNMVCQQQACVKPGKYRARACAALNGGSNAKNGGCTPKEEQLCTEVEFEFPGTKTVTLELGK